VAIYFAVAAGALVLLYWLSEVILLAFVAVLIAILLDLMASFGRNWLRLPHGAAVIISALALVAVLAGAAALLTVPLLRESTGFFDTFKKESAELSEKMSAWKLDYPWLAEVLPNFEEPPKPSDQPSASGVAKKALLTLSAVIDFGANALAVFFLAIFLAWSPARWLRGAAELGPRETVEARMDLYRRIGGALRSYLLTYGIYILAMGTLWGLGLWLIGIDYFLVFGVLGGLVEVAPYVGPFIGLIPPLIMSLLTVPDKAIYVLLLYVVLHIIEGYMLVPWLMHEREHLPPPIIVLSLLGCGAVFGLLGVLLAVPIGTTAYVIANETIYRRQGETLTRHS
jgi:predicted PurR-regulated permease PerM